MLLGLLATLSGAAAPLGLLVPAYFYPPAEWDGLNFAAPRVPLLVIVNPGSGPGVAPDPNYVAAVNNLRSAGGKTLGYVYSSYATRDPIAVRADVTNFFNWYALDGIFVDEMANDANPSHYDYYAGLNAFIAAQGTNLLVVGNPGTTTQESYLAGAGALVTFENHSDYSNYVADAWVTNQLARRFCHIIYGMTNATTMTNYIDLAVRRNVGWVFVTDHTNAANPYDRLPSYWTNEVDYVRARNAAAPAPRLEMVAVSNGVATLQLTGESGVYEVSTSSNLTSWAATTNLNLGASPATFSDPGAQSASVRFYRTRQ